MKTLHPFMVVTGLMTACAQAETVGFDDAKTGMTPPGWTATMTGAGHARWTVETDDTAPSKPNVLKQSGAATYPVCIKDATKLYVDDFAYIPLHQQAVVWAARKNIDLFQPADNAFPLRHVTVK